MVKFVFSMILIGLVGPSAKAGPVALDLSTTGMDVSSTFSGQVFSLKKHKELFSFEGAVFGLGKEVAVTRRFKDETGQEIMVEGVSLVNGKFKVFEMNESQLGTSSLIERKGKTLHFTYVKNGEKQTSEETYPENFVVAPVIPLFIANNWAAINEGKFVKVRMGIPDRLETIGFQFMKIGHETRNGKALTHIRLKPSSALISAFVNPIDFLVDPDSKDIFEYTGRISPKIKIDGAWKPMDGKVLVAYPGLASKK